MFFVILWAFCHVRSDVIPVLVRKRLPVGTSRRSANKITSCRKEFLFTTARVPSTFLQIASAMFALVWWLDKTNIEPSLLKIFCGHSGKYCKRVILYASDFFRPICCYFIASYLLRLTLNWALKGFQSPFPRCSSAISARSMLDET